MDFSPSLILIELNVNGFAAPVNAWYADGSSVLSMLDLSDPIQDAMLLVSCRGEVTPVGYPNVRLYSTVQFLTHFHPTFLYPSEHSMHWSAELMQVAHLQKHPWQPVGVAYMPGSQMSVLVMTGVPLTGISPMVLRVLVDVVVVVMEVGVVVVMVVGVVVVALARTGRMGMMGMVGTDMMGRVVLVRSGARVPLMMEAVPLMMDVMVVLVALASSPSTVCVVTALLVTTTVAGTMLVLVLVLMLMGVMPVVMVVDAVLIIVVLAVEVLSAVMVQGTTKGTLPLVRMGWPVVVVVGWLMMNDGSVLRLVGVSGLVGAVVNSPNDEGMVENDQKSDAENPLLGVPNPFILVLVLLVVLLLMMSQLLSCSALVVIAVLVPPLILLLLLLLALVLVLVISVLVLVLVCTLRLVSGSVLNVPNYQNTGIAGGMVDADVEPEVSVPILVPVPVLVAVAVLVLILLLLLLILLLLFAFVLAILLLLLLVVFVLAFIVLVFIVFIVFIALVELVLAVLVLAVDAHADASRGRTEIIDPLAAQYSVTVLSTVFTLDIISPGLLTTLNYGIPTAPDADVDDLALVDPDAGDISTGLFIDAVFIFVFVFALIFVFAFIFVFMFELVFIFVLLIRPIFVFEPMPVVVVPVTAWLVPVFRVVFPVVVLVLNNTGIPAGTWVLKLILNYLSKLAINAIASNG